MVGTAGATDGTWLGPVKVSPRSPTPRPASARRRSAWTARPAVSLGKAPVAVAGEGEHTVAGDGHGRGRATRRRPADVRHRYRRARGGAAGARRGGSSIPTVTPNGDKARRVHRDPLLGVGARDRHRRRQRTAPGSRSRTIGRQGRGRAPRGALGRANGQGHRRSGWPLHRHAHRHRPGRQRLGVPVAAPVDVYAALSAISRTPALFFPQDGDALAPKSTVRFTLLPPPACRSTSWMRKGTVVRSAWTDRDLEAGAQSWSWNGKLADGTWARARHVPVPRPGDQRRAGGRRLRRRPGRRVPRGHLDGHVAGPGAAFTITAVTAERLATAPRITVRQPGVIDLVRAR